MADPTNVGASNNNPNMATPQAESEGTANPSTTTVVGAGQVQGSQNPVPGSENLGSIVLTSGDPDAVALLNAGDTINGLTAQLAPALDPPAKGAAPRTGRSTTVVLGAMDSTVALLKARPALGTGVNVSITDLAATADQVRAGIALANTLTVLLADVEGTLKVRSASGWADVRSVYRTAAPQAATDGVIDQWVTPMAALFARAKRAVVAVQAVGTAVLRAANATVRTTNANAKVTQSRQRAATVAPQLAVTGEGDALINQPAPQAPAPTPASSTTALAATPGTLGSTTIR